MISISKHNCTEDAISSKNRFSLMNASMKKRENRDIRRDGRMAEGRRASRYVPSPEFAQMWPACLNKCERDDEDTCREIRKSVAKYSPSVTPRGRVEEKRLDVCDVRRKISVFFQIEMILSRTLSLNYMSRI